MKKSEIIEIYGTDYKEMTIRLLKEAQLADCIRAKAGCLPDPLIGIKPNLVSPTPAEFGATTHPQIAAGIIEYLHENHFYNIVICEGSWVGDKTSDAFEYCGYNVLARKYGIKLFDTQKDSSFRSAAQGLELNICSIVRKVNFLINVPVLKGHCQTKITCALKNMKGLIPNSEKRRFHAMGLHKPIALLNKCIHQDFIVIDNICGDPYFEDGGNPMVRNCIMAARDPVLADSFCCSILDIDQRDVAYISLAHSIGVGNSDTASISIRTLSDHGSCDHKKPALSDISSAKRDIPLELNYATSEIESCSSCYSALTGALEVLNKEGLLHRITDEKGYRFCIGQGYKKTVCTDEKCIGTGSCTGGFIRNIPGCPPSSEDIAAYLRKLL